MPAPALSTAELTAMQAEANVTLDQSVVIKRLARINDGTGHYAENWSTVTTTTCNLFQPSEALMQNYGYVIGNLATWQVRLPVGTDIQENDELIVGGQTLRVQILIQPRSHQINLHVLASEVE